jgi:hypothetical protein
VALPLFLFQAREAPPARTDWQAWHDQSSCSATA